jgi:predicted glutamine amidotransferase
MCGICAVVSSSLTLAETETFKDLLLVNQLRGFDSTGVFSVDKKTEVSKRRWMSFKEAAEASYFLNSEDKHGVKKALLASGHGALVGHCRWATIGKVSAKNAHPFSFDNVIGVHNGTLRKVFKGSDLFETDSEALYALINEVGIEEALNEIQTYTETDTAYALIYYDKIEDTLNFVRNGQRPLYLAVDSSNNTLMVSSESEAVFFAAKRHNISFNADGIFSLKPHVLMSIRMDTNEYDLRERHKFTELKIKKPEWSSSNQSSSTGYWVNGVFKPYKYSGAFYGMEDWPDEDLPPDPNARPPFEPDGEALCCDIPPAQQEEKPKPSVPVVSGKDLVKPVEKARNFIFKGWKGMTITRIAMGKMCYKGCAACGRQVDVDMPDLDRKIGWAAPDRIVCSECMTRPHILKYWVKYSMLINEPTQASLQ